MDQGFTLLKLIHVHTDRQTALLWLDGLGGYDSWVITPAK